ncbi:MAG: hypothetical protein E6Q97_20525 [Desulfurellales bacterium]|nr:MAG: hypothetical protein E6Q97_20525 [Desulfurellales bacterium]
MKATEFLQTIVSLTGEVRDKKIVNAAKTDLRRFDWLPVPLDEGRGFFRVASDYVSIGDETDWVRVPMGGNAAQAIADQEKSVLPCPYMVELIDRAAKVRLRPIELGTSKMMSTQRFAEHNAKIEGLRERRGGLISGIKKDIVVSNKLENKPHAVCIYGWYRPNGTPIQSISTKHEITYSDYSHGVRLVHPEMVLDDKTVLVQDVMRDPRVAAVLTGGKAWGQKHDAPDDGVLRVVRYGVQPKPEAPKAEPERPVIDLSPPKSNTLGDKCIDWCIAEMNKGVREEPKGSKTSKRIAEYFEPARRRGTEKLLGIKAADWCAVGQSASLLANTSEGEDVPHGYRAAVRELREDAQQTGAWVPIADVRSGKYELRRGDLLVLRRGSAGLGHVVRVQDAFKTYVFALGANEDDTWKRSMRNLDDKDLEGAISYYRFNPGLKLQRANVNLTSSPPQSSALVVAPAPDDAGVDVWARGVVLRAWDNLFPGKPITTPELQTLMAIARLERFYGLTNKPTAGIGKKNWGGIQCPKGECDPAKCYKGGDIDKNGVPYPICFRIYATDEEGAGALIFQVTTRRPDVWDAMKSGNITAVAHRMAIGRNVDGKWVGVYHETNPAKYAAGLWTHAQILTKNLGIPLAVRLAENSPTPTQVVMDQSQHTPEYKRPPAAHTPAYAPTVPQSGRQRGIRALVASRRPELANVIVGATPNTQTNVSMLEERLDKTPIQPVRLKEDCACADASYARSMHPHTSGITTSTEVIDHANRVDNYVRALHKIVADANSSGRQNPNFPWTEWAAFRVSWDMVYFDITHSFIPNFDDNVVAEYDAQAKKWEGVIAQYYSKRPAVGPVIGDEYAGLKIGLGVAAGLGLLFVASRSVS